MTRAVRVLALTVIAALAGCSRGPAPSVQPPPPGLPEAAGPQPGEPPARPADPAPQPAAVAETGSAAEPPAQAAGVGGRIQGLAGKGLVLSVEGRQPVRPAPGASSYWFPGAVEASGAFALTVAAQPTSPAQTCTVGPVEGTPGAPGWKGPAVTCVTERFAIGGTVTGVQGTGVVLTARVQGLPAEDVAVSQPGTFRFPTPGPAGASWTVSLKSQPTKPAQICTMAEAKGVLEGEVTSIAVSCAEAPPAGLSYALPKGALVKGVAIAPVAPASTGGAVQEYAVSPPLPDGLTLDPVKGVIAGKPAALSPGSTHVVTARNGSGSTTATIAFSVVDVAPSGLAYPAPDADYRVGKVVPPNVPTVSGGAIVSWTVSPPLPAGLSLDPASGAITGVPSATSSPAAYTVTAANSGGSATATVRIGVRLYALGGAVTGLHGSGLVVSTPGQPDVAVPAGSAVFAFPERVASGTAYQVVVKGQPAGPPEHCTVAKGTGTVGTSDVSGIAVSCSPSWKIVAGGEAHSLGIRPDGTLWAWGANGDGQLGDDGEEDRGEPVPLGTGYAAVAAGMRHSLALKSDGTLLAWGGNEHGQLGLGHRRAVREPAQVGTGFAAVAAGHFHTVAVKKDGTLWAWGNGLAGQLGDGATASQLKPVQVGSGFAAVAAGYRHTLAVKKDGTLWAWGANDFGQLGDGTTTPRTAPVRIGDGYVAVAAGEFHSVALRVDGTVVSWGGNTQGQLGDGTTAARHVPRPVGGGFTAISAGHLHTVALKGDGSVWAWGYNFHGQVREGSAANEPSPVKVGTGFTAVAAGGFHTLARRIDGTAQAWGRSDHGQLGEGLQAAPRKAGRPGKGLAAARQ
ncbi:MAG TPA: putative Ig domain-containing protein [Anaeromyxobacteraceae bacterium]|nr:putative Ig domain-containing protein [Anaeromyxobacteraceae bacterium]